VTRSPSSSSRQGTPVHLAFPGTTADALVGGAYLLWIVVTLCGVWQCRHVFPGIVSTLAPSWPLFAPTPIHYNYDLAFRTRRADGEFSPWKPLPTSYTRAFHHAVWNPGFDEQVFLFRLCQALVELHETDRSAERLRQGAYDFLLSLIALRVGEQPDTIQFAIRRCCPLIPDGAELFLVSADDEPVGVS
jgi:hypothetical protein